VGRAKALSGGMSRSGGRWGAALVAPAEGVVIGPKRAPAARIRLTRTREIAILRPGF
jgi:hypothetical protein